MEKGRTLRNVLLLEKKRKIGGGIYTNYLLSHRSDSPEYIL